MLEYPKMVYRTKEDYKIADSFEDEELFLKDGYGEAEIMLLGKKPKEVDTEPKKTIVEAKVKRKRRTREQMAAIRGDSK